MRFHLFPFRTQKLSSFTSTILGGWPPGKIDNADIKEESTDTCAFFTYSSLAQSVERVTVNHDAVGSSPTGGAIKKSHHQVAFFYCTCTNNTVIKSHASPTEPGEVGGKACFAPLLHQKICKKFFDVIVAVFKQNCCQWRKKRAGFGAAVDFSPRLAELRNRVPQVEA